MTYSRLFYHLTWSTKHRMPVIDAHTEEILTRALPGIARKKGCLTHAVGIMPEHVHLALTIPTRLTVADAAKAIKGSTSHLLRHQYADVIPDWAGWQNEYGIVTFSEWTLPKIVSYVTHQREHHANNILIPELEREERDPEPTTP
jgi:REP element-mobilizing transposase RayT